MNCVCPSILHCTRRTIITSTTLAARQGKARRGEGDYYCTCAFPLSFPYLPSFRFTSRPYSSAASRWNNGTMEDLHAHRRITHAQVQARERVHRTLTVVPSSAIYQRSHHLSSILHHQTLEPEPRDPAPFLNLPEKKNREKLRREGIETCTLRWYG